MVLLGINSLVVLTKTSAYYPTKNDSSLAHSQFVNLHCGKEGSFEVNDEGYFTEVEGS